MADGGDKKRRMRIKYDELVATQAAAKKAKQDAGVAGPISRGDQLHASLEEYMQYEEDRVANLVAPSRLGGNGGSDSANALERQKLKGALSSAADGLVKAAFSSAVNAVKKESIADAAKAAKKEPIADAAKDDFAKKEHEPEDEVFTNDEVVFLQEMAARGDGAKSMVAADLLQERRQRLVEWMDDERGGSGWREASPEPADETAAQDEPEPADTFLARIAARGDELQGRLPD